jgi:SsrA-binding protein
MTPTAPRKSSCTAANSTGWPALQLKGHALIPLKLYLARGRIKIELGLGKGKLLFDKRETLRRKTADRETAREMRN